MELFARVALGATAGTSRRKQVPLFSRNDNGQCGVVW